MDSNKVQTKHAQGQWSFIMTGQFDSGRGG